MKTARMFKSGRSASGADWRAYELDPPLKTTRWDGDSNTEVDVEVKYVVVSAVVAMFSGPETFIFPGDADGKIVDWGELDGSFRGGLDHERALSNIGYKIAT